MRSHYRDPSGGHAVFWTNGIASCLINQASSCWLTEVCSLTSAVEVAKEDKAVEWLLDNKNPAIRYWTLKDLLGEPENEYEVVQAREQIASWTPVAEYLNEQNSEVFWGSVEEVYSPKWTATVWPLILLAKIGLP